MKTRRQTGACYALINGKENIRLPRLISGVAYLEWNCTDSLKTCDAMHGIAVDNLEVKK